MKRFGLSQRRSCRLSGLSRTAFSYLPKRSQMNEKISLRLKELAAKHRRWGHPTLHRLIRREGLLVNKKRTARIYRLEGLSLRIRRRKKLASFQRVPLKKPERPNQVWSMDFVHDAFWSGRRFKILTLVDTFTRECLAAEADTSLNGPRVASILERIADMRGYPKAIRIDNGPEFISQVLDEWAYRTGVHLDRIDPGKPVQNAYIESFNGRFRDNCLNQNYFLGLSDAREKIGEWKEEYNTVRPHGSLKGLTPQEFVNTWREPDQQTAPEAKCAVV
jgi:putative transposase